MDAISEIIETGEGGLKIYFIKKFLNKNSGISRFVTLPIEIPEKTSFQFTPGNFAKLFVIALPSALETGLFLKKQQDGVFITSRPLEIPEQGLKIVT